MHKRSNLFTADAIYEYYVDEALRAKPIKTLRDQDTFLHLSGIINPAHTESVLNESKQPSEDTQAHFHDMPRSFKKGPYGQMVMLWRPDTNGNEGLGGRANVIVRISSSDKDDWYCHGIPAVDTASVVAHAKQSDILWDVQSWEIIPFADNVHLISKRSG